ncbi:MAG TPA: UDP-N-acetylglucosamine 2-epimerase [Nitrospirales bacterium]|nr:UDP-N-acetylglucosamine 2-epimerase (hydrolyzing) [Nitrospiraceae bacterium]HNP28151.1 UDP-N-acetylglucosamine 2-epimerase [Nitrospirales bacterium]
MKRKVCVVITARPSYSRIRSALEAIKQHSDLELQIVVAASALLERYGRAEQVIEEEGFHIDRRVYMILEGENPVTSAKSTGLGLAELATVFSDLRPDMVITIADRFETMATAVCAAYMNIPLVHVQGGEITGSIDEKVRHAVTKLADIHLVSTQKAAERVIRMGEHPNRVFVTGCPSIDLAKRAIENPTLTLDTIFEKYGGVGPRFGISQQYLVVMQHPVTTEYSQARRHIEETLHAIKQIDMPTLWFWPNVDAGSDGTSTGIRAFREHHTLPHIHFFKNMPPDDFIQVLHHSTCLIGNSSVGIRECAFLGTPVVNIGSRQTGRDRGHNVVDADYARKDIIIAIEKQMAAGNYPPDSLYGKGDAGQTIANLLPHIELGIEKRLTF